MTIWDKIYKHYQKTGEPYASISANFNPDFIKFIQNSSFPNKKVLDIGCGTGNYLKFLKNKGFDIHGIDSSETAIKIAKDILGSDTDIKVADMHSIDLPNETYGLIFSIAAIHHGKKQQVSDLIDKIYSALVQDGKLFITLPIYWSKKDSKGGVEFLGDGEFILLTGPEKGLIHSSYRREEVERMLSKFNNISVQENDKKKRWVISAIK